MLLKLRNVGMIESADIRLDGLTVIAGENDTGKSTIGKTLMLLVKTEAISRGKYYKKRREIKEKDENYDLERYFLNNRFYGFQRLRELMFENFLKSHSEIVGEIVENSSIEFQFFDKDKKQHIKVFWNSDNAKWEYDFTSCGIEVRFPFIDATYIQSPLLWDLQSFFNSIAQMKIQVELEEDIKFEFSYPYLLWDLYGKLIKKRINFVSLFHKKLIEQIKENIGGEFVKKEGNVFVFRKKNVDIPLIDVAHGIKSFGILQILLENGYVGRKGILIIDEPEVHLHPKWQIFYARLIVDIVRNGTKVIINTHSPYILQALITYSKDLKNEVNFYLCQKENAYVKKIFEVNDEIEKIFKLLADPFNEVF